MDKRFLSVKEACQEYGVCRATICKYAKQAEALRRIGARVLIDDERFRVWMRHNAFLESVGVDC